MTDVASILQTLLDRMRREVAALEMDRNNRNANIDWRTTTKTPHRTESTVSGTMSDTRYCLVEVGAHTPMNRIQ